MKSTVAAGAALVLLPVASALAAPLSPQDGAFVTQAAQDGMAEVAEGRLAVSQAASLNLQGFGQHVIDSQSKTDQELAKLAQQRGLQTPTALDTTDQQIVSRLHMETGARFDRDYLRSQVSGDQEMAQVMHTEIQSGQDPQLRALAQRTLAVVQDRLRLARQLQSKLA